MEAVIAIILIVLFAFRVYVEFRESCRKQDATREWMEARQRVRESAEDGEALGFFLGYHLFDTAPQEDDECSTK